MVRHVRTLIMSGIAAVIALAVTVPALAEGIFATADNHVSASAIRITNTTTGTAPFDQTDGNGNDTSAQNTVIRSFDTVSWDAEVTLTPDDPTNYYQQATFSISAFIPLDDTQIEFATNEMGWADNMTVKPVNGGQLLTATRTVTGNQTMPTVAPGTASVQIVARTLNLANKTTFTPTFAAWMGDQSQRATTTGQALTASSTVSLNVRLRTQITNTQLARDFSSNPNKRADTPDLDQGILQGVNANVQASVEARWSDRSKGVRGLFIPAEPIAVDYQLSANWKNNANMSYDGSDVQPRVWDNFAYYRKQTPVWLGFTANSSSTPTNASTVLGETNTTVTHQQGATRIHMTIQGFSRSHFPYGTNGTEQQQQCSPHYMAADCNAIEVAGLHSEDITLLLPTILNNGTSIAELLGGDEQTVTLTARDINLTVGDRPVSQAVTSDDEQSDSAMITMSKPGFKQIMRYSKNTSWSDEGSIGNWGNKTVKYGSDILRAGQDSNLNIGFASQYASPADFSTGAVQLVTVDPKTISFQGATHINHTTTTWQFANKPLPSTVTVQYATKPDCTTWVNQNEQATATLSDLKLHTQLPANCPVVGAVIIEPLNYEQVGTTLGVAINHGVSVPIHINVTAQQDTVSPVFEQTWMFSRATMAQSAKLSVTASGQAWQDWSNAQNWVAIAKTHAPTWYRTGSNYTPARFTANCTYQSGEPVGDDRGGDTACITVEQGHIQVSADKERYNLDNGERTITWSAQVDTLVDEAIASYDTDVTVQLALPKGLSYVTRSATVDGVSVEPELGSRPYTSVRAEIRDGTNPVPTLTWKLKGVQARSSHTVQIQTTIGMADNPAADVVNNQQLMVRGEVSTRYNPSEARSELGNLSEVAVHVTKLNQTGLATNMTPNLMEQDGQATVVLVSANPSTSSYQHHTVVSVLPRDGFHGSYTTGTLRFDALPAGVRLMVTTDPVDEHRLSWDVVSGWREIPITDNTATLPDRVTAWGLLVPELSTGARIVARQPLTFAGNQVSDQYTNLWTDTHNITLASTSVIASAITGVVWRDTNANGKQDANEGVFKNAQVTLTNNQGTPVATASTDTEGRYTFTALKHGEYKVQVSRGADSVPAGVLSTYAYTDQAGKDMSSPITLGINATVPHVDFGYPVAERKLSNLPVSGRTVMLIVTMIAVGLIVAAVVALRRR